MWWMSIANAAGSFAPTAATKIAEDWDSLYKFLLVASLISCVILLGGMIYFLIKYRRKTDKDKTAYITHNSTLEFLWSFIPLVIFLVVFVWGWEIFHSMRNPPENATEIHVFAKQWLWDFEYKTGKKTTGEVVVPVGVPIKMIMTSTDVIHSFFVPSFRIKQDVVPGRYTAAWFQSEKLGEFHLFCTEFCGADHSGMLGKIKVVSKPDYEKWLASAPEVVESGSALGEKLFKQKGCIGCHTVDGTPKVGPTFKGLFGRKSEFADGTTLNADENYIRESILNPSAKVVKGFPNGAMPAFQGQLSESEVSGIIEFIKDQK
jgi:cytochrome c oxidase subunit 2